MHRAVCAAVALLVVPPCDGGDLGGSELRTTIGANEYLVAGSELIRAGDFDDGIRLTLAGLERGSLGTRDRAAGLGNLCAAYVSKDEPDAAIPYCDRSLGFDDRNWRVYTTRARAYYLKKMFAEARRDNEAAAAINPSSAHVKELRAKINEHVLRPQVILEDHH